jgi:hypothetical protein
MGFAGLERDPQRLVRTEQMLLADHFVDIAGPQAFGERNIGTGFFKHDVLGIISAFPDAVRTMAACCPMSSKPARSCAGNVLHYDSDGLRTSPATRVGGKSTGFKQLDLSESPLKLPANFRDRTS